MPLSFSTPKKPLSHYSLAGLADVVLLLLIFFLLTSNFIPHFGIQVNLPQAETSAPTDAQYVTVVITEDGRYFVNQQPVRPDDLLTSVSAIRGDKTTLVLRADKNATVGQFADVANVARALGLRVSMATERGSLRPR